MTKGEAGLYRSKIERAAKLLDDETALDSIDLFPSWTIGIWVEIGERYKYNGKLYKVVQKHLTQSDWTPDISASLFTEVSVEEWPEWKQPIGASEVYSKGDKVSHNNKHWISDYDNNSWEPGVFGWTMVE